MDHFVGRPELNLDRGLAAIAALTNPGVVAIARNLNQVAHRTEANVSNGKGISVGLDVVLDESDPRYDPDDPFVKYMRRWAPDERRHAILLGALLERAGIETLECRAEDEVPPYMERVGMGTRSSDWLKHSVRLAGAVQVTTTEVLTKGVYPGLGDLFGRNGEEEIADAVYGQIAPDETGHYVGGRKLARYLRDGASRAQILLAREIVVINWTPVGAGDEPGKVAFGKALVEVDAMAAKEDIERPQVQAELEERVIDMGRQRRVSRKPRPLGKATDTITKEMLAEVNELLPKRSGRPVKDFMTPQMEHIMHIGRQATETEKAEEARAAA
jgi:hypothetical protein